MRELFAQLGRTLAAGESAVVVTVTASSGSVPRGAGARMLVTRAGRVRGTIGGGAVEHQAELTAREALAEGRCRQENFQLRPNEVRDLGMICGGDVTVDFHVFPACDPVALAVVEEVEKRYQAGRPAWLILTAAGGRAAMSLWGDGVFAGAPVPEEVLAALGRRPGRLDRDGSRYYWERLVAPETVYIFGGGHVSQALVPVLAAVEFRCVVLEDREEFARRELFPGAADVRLADLGRVAEAAAITAEDYVVIMTRGHRDDLLIQAQALRTPARYIGVIGSARKKAGVFDQLRRQGFTDQDLARITTPIGLSIQARTPAEIAVSIAAQLIQVRAAE